jgi:hypothetical protein
MPHWLQPSWPSSSRGPGFVPPGAVFAADLDGHSHLLAGGVTGSGDWSFEFRSPGHKAESLDPPNHRITRIDELTTLQSIPGAFRAAIRMVDVHGRERTLLAAMTHRLGRASAQWLISARARTEIPQRTAMLAALTTGDLLLRRDDFNPRCLQVPRHSYRTARANASEPRQVQQGQIVDIFGDASQGYKFQIRHSGKRR